MQSVNLETRYFSKMTNKDGDAPSNCKPRMAAMLAVHLVSQILDEAYVIANAAIDSGQPWQYMSMLKSFKASRLDMEDSYEASKGDWELNDNNTGIVVNVVATSTPQKGTRLGCSDGTEESMPSNDAACFGQGDEDLEKRQNEFINSTSMFINHLFDMSDVERVICEDTNVIESISKSKDFSLENMNNNIESANTITSVVTLPLEPNIHIIDGPVPKELSSSDNSNHSFLADAFVADITRDVTFYIEDDCEKRKNVETYEMADVKEIQEETYHNEQVDESNENRTKKNDVALFENAYVTLNRDYDQGSDEGGFPVLQDPKGMNLQEVELMTACTSDDYLPYPDFQEKQKLQASVPTVTGIGAQSGSQKSSLVRRCRTQGARLLSCIRGWWRRKTPGKRKESRGPITLGICPLSPGARRRASSLLDNRLLRPDSPSHPIVWKFNTVNEALVNSNRWKDYTFDIRPDDY